MAKQITLNWLIALAICLLAGSAFHIDDWHLTLGPDDIATEQLVASTVAELGAQPAAKPAARPWYKNTREHIHIACGSPGYINSSKDIQCVDAEGNATFYVYVLQWELP